MALERELKEPISYFIVLTVESALYALQKMDQAIFNQ